MGKRQIKISYYRIKKYIKKYWWLLVGSAVVGIIAFGCGVNSNRKAMSMVQEVYKYQKILLFSADENDLTDNYIGDFNVFITTDEFKEKVYGKEKNISVEVVRLANSNCSSIIVTSNEKEKAKIVTEKIVEEGKNFFNSIYPQILVTDVTSKEVIGERESVHLIQLKDILMLIGPLMIGIFCIYILIIFDESIYTVKELEDFLDIPVCQYTQEECVGMISQMQNQTIIVGRGLTEIITEKENVVSIGEFLRKKKGLGSPKTLLVKAEYITAGELEELMQVIARDTEKQFNVLMLSM